jgi:hypothetical protein
VLASWLDVDALLSALPSPLLAVAVTLLARGAAVSPSAPDYGAAGQLAAHGQCEKRAPVLYAAVYSPSRVQTWLAATRSPIIAAGIWPIGYRGAVADVLIITRIFGAPHFEGWCATLLT